MLYVKLNTALFSFFFQQTGTYSLYNLIQENSKKFYGISQRQHVFPVYVTHSNCARLHFFFMIDYGENGFLHSKMWAKMTQN